MHSDDGIVPVAPDVIIWRVDLLDAAWDASQALLTDDERWHADRLLHPDARRRFLRRRAALRCVLARHPGPHVSASHRADVAAIAVSSHPLGIDIETGVHAIDVDTLAPRVCHPSERWALAALAPAQRAGLFARLWTRKEAFCKAAGSGLQDSVAAVWFEPAGPGRAAVRGAPADGRGPWFVYDVPDFSGCVASVCTAPGARLGRADAGPP